MKPGYVHGLPLLWACVMALVLSLEPPACSPREQLLNPSHQRPQGPRPGPSQLRLSQAARPSVVLPPGPGLPVLSRHPSAGPFAPETGTP